MHPTDDRNSAYEQVLLYEEARIRRDQGNTSGAFARYRRLWDFAEANANRELMATVAQEIGEMYHRSYETLPARHWYEQARAVSEELCNHNQMAWLNFRLAEVAQLLGELSEAEALFRQALTDSEKSDDATLEPRIRSGLGQLLCTRDRWEEGFAECVTAVRQARHADGEVAAHVCEQVRAMAERIGRARYRRLLAGAVDDLELRRLLAP